MRRFIAQSRNVGFCCLNCGAEVPPLTSGSCRNHCPHCLYSLHLDVNPGDRASDCRGLLEPVAVSYSGKKGWIIHHRCRRCGALRRNKAALEDAVPDNYQLIIALARRPS